MESHHPGYPGSQDTFYVGTLKGVGRICQQTLVDTSSKWATAKPYATKTPITGADVPNDRVLPFLASQQMGGIRILTDRGTEYRTEKTHQGKMCRGGTPMQTLPDGKKLWNEGSDSLTRRTGTTSKRKELSDQV